jgi:hypothetical protein
MNLSLGQLIYVWWRTRSGYDWKVAYQGLQLDAMQKVSYGVWGLGIAIFLLGYWAYLRNMKNVVCAIMEGSNSGDSRRIST